MKSLVAALLLLASITVQAQTPPMPVCYPDVVLPAKFGVIELPEGANLLYTHVAGWTCRVPTGYKNQLWMFNVDNVTDALVEIVTTGSFNEQAARDKCAQTCQEVVPTPAEEAAAAPLIARLAIAIVSQSASTTRPVYALDAAGARITTPVPNARVMVGDRCWIDRRLGTTGYYSVEGQPNVATSDPNDRLGAVYSVCQFIAPMGLND